MIVELLGVREEMLIPLALMFGVLLSVAPEMLMFEDTVTLLLIELGVFMLAALKFSCVLDCA
jgi:hypothetical protein